MQEAFQALESSERNEAFAEYAFLIWRRITPSGNPMAPPRVVTTIDVKSEYLRSICEEVIGSFTGILWDEKPLRVSGILFKREEPAEHSFEERSTRKFLLHISRGSGSKQGS